MIPALLKISGFLSYHEAVELDFCGFDLACISGANGAGKSSLLDAITWALFGQARRRDDALLNSRSDSAEVILDFHYEDNFYRVQRSKTRGKSNCLDFFIRNTDGNWKSLTEHSLKETEAQIQQMLHMDYETFTNVSFFLQGKADQFTQQRPGDRKRILSNILGLDTWDNYREKTSLRRRQSENELAVTNAQLEEIQNEIQQEPERQKQLKELEAQLKQLIETRITQQSILENVRQLRASLSEQKKLVDTLFDQFQASCQRMDMHKEQLLDKKEEYQSCLSKINSESEIEAAYQRWQTARQELERWEEIAADFRQFEAQRSQPLIEIEKERASLTQQLKSYLEQQQQVMQTKNQLIQLDTSHQEAEIELNSLTSRLQKRQEIEQTSQLLLEKQTQIEAENKQLRAEMHELKDRIDRLKESEGANCPLCEQPLAPVERQQLIALLESQGKEMGDRYRQNQILLEQNQQHSQDIKKELAETLEVDTALRQQQRVVDQMAQQKEQLSSIIDEWEKIHSRRLSELNKIIDEDDFAPTARDKLSEIDEHLRKLGYDAAAHDAVRRAERDGKISEEQMRQLQSAKAVLEPLQKAVLELEKQIETDEREIDQQKTIFQQAEDRLKREEAELPDQEKAESELFLLQEKENLLRTEIGGAVQRIEVMQSLKKRLVEMNSQRSQLSLNISRLKTLERAFSNDGIPALLIEQSLPEIEIQTNDLLDRLSAGSMSVRFITQRDYKNKNREDKKETLDILISDSAGTREYEMFSGGESFRINFAIRLALSRVLAQRAGARLQTLVIDEGFGNQDAAGRQRLLEAINLVRPDFAKILVITHLDDLKEAFPARIEVEKNGRGSNLRVVT